MRPFPMSALVALAAVTACAAPAPDPHGVGEGETLLTATGTGRSETAPDQATFTAGLSSIAATAEAATNRNSETITRIASSLVALGIDKRDIQTRNVSVQRIEYGPNRGRFEANNTLGVRMRQVDKVGQAIAAATSAGANIVSGPNLTVADPERAALNAYAVAYKAARAKADAYANAAGLRVARVLAIHDGGGGGETVSTTDAMAQSRGPVPVAAPPPVVMAGTNASLVSVRVEFALEPK